MGLSRAQGALLKVGLAGESPADAWLPIRLPPDPALEGSGPLSQHHLIATGDLIKGGEVAPPLPPHMAVIPNLGWV